MTKKQKSDSQVSSIHGLVVFKGRLAQIEQEKIKTAPIIEDVDQENKIIVSYEVLPYGAGYKCSVLLENQSMAPITEIKARVKYPNSLLLKRHYPPTIRSNVPTTESGQRQINFEIDKLDKNSKQQINFYFAPLLINVKGEFLASMSYINNKGFIRALNLEPIEIKIIPITIQPKIIPSSQIADFLKIDGIKKAIKSHGIGLKTKGNLPLLYFNHMEQLLKMYNFQLIAKDDKKDNKIMWFFGNETSSNSDVLCIAQIINNKVEFLAASKNPTILVSLLTKLSNDFKTSISSTGMVSLEHIYNLECKNCGNVPNYFPEKGETIECQNCHTKQVIW
ncbi:MAG: hypothetical protein ACFFAH_06980 [Promethearchaeota archaeon]